MINTPSDWRPVGTSTSGHSTTSRAATTTANDAWTNPLFSDVTEGRLEAHRTRAMNHRMRSHSENTTSHPSSSELLMDSDDEERSPLSPVGIARGDSRVAGGISIPSARSRRNRRDFFLHGRLSPTSSEEAESNELQTYSTSYAGPREFTNYTFEMAKMTGYLEKQSVKSPHAWKRRWFVMQDSVLFYYRREEDAVDTKPSDRTCCGVIQLDSVDSVTTAKDFGVGAFQIRLAERKYILRADTKESMHDWLFNFQKSIANIVSMLLRSKTDHRLHRGSHSVTRRSFSRVSRSVSFDCPDPFEGFGRMSADFPSHHFQSGFVDSGSFSDDSLGENVGARSSPRRASSPTSYSHFGPRSPVAMFAFDPPFESIGDDGLNMDFYGGADGTLVEGQEDEDEDEVVLTAPTGVIGLDAVVSPPVTTESPMLQRTLSPPVSSGKYIPRFLRDRQNAVSAAPPPAEVISPPQSSPPPTSSSSSLSWLLRGTRENYAVCTRESETVFFDDEVSFTAGGEAHGVTSLKGVRKNLEDVCCCVPDLREYTQNDEYSRHSLYALFDGHCGVRAAQYLNEKLLPYLCGHDSFMTNARQAFEECFKRIDEEFLDRAMSEMISDGSTAAVVLIRGNKLLTANAGDSRAVVSVNGVALDVIEEQTPGRPDERERIERLGGWVKEERELQMSKLHSMDLSDPRIQQKAERVVRWVSVYRVNGELAVSRSIGDVDYKGKTLMDYEFWAFPEGHDRKFLGDLVVCDPEFKEIEITPEVNFLILACDGLWDTITSQEAVNHVKEKISEGYSTSQISHSLADLAIRSGSSDNVSVIVVLLQPN